VAEEIIMRIAKPQDADCLRRLVNETIDTCYFHIYPQEAIDYFKDYHNRKNIVNDILEGHCLILTSGDKFIGTGTLLGPNARRVFVKPAYQNMGLGKRIMHGLEEKAVEKGVRIIDLDASLVAYPFYRALGYETQAEYVIPVKNGQNLKYYKMVKKIEDK
jgi:GNAT superfamily N-acetyltransferase